MSESIQDDLASAVRSVAKDWKKEKRQADRNDRVSPSRLSRLRIWKPPKVTIRKASFQVMEAAYMKASGNGRYHANGRQIMYAARGPVQKLTDGEIWKNSSYFTQTLLKDYIEEYGATDWKVVWDARGHITEPYTERVVGLCGVEVGKYISEWTTNFSTHPYQTTGKRIDTVGPSLRFGAVLFIEKEGFDEILKESGLCEKYDMAIMSTKGIPVGAACHLAAKFNSVGIKVMVLHDFDLDGFKIVKTLREGTRLAPGSDVVDIGLRIGDVKGLESEAVEYRRDKDPRDYLRLCGASEAERSFLVDSGGYGGWSGQRVELNAMTSEQFITWLEQALKKNGVSKHVPDRETLERAYLRASFLQSVDSAIEKIVEEEKKKKKIKTPGDLSQRIHDVLAEDETESWDMAVWRVAKSQAKEE